MNVFEWLETTYHPRRMASNEFIYDDMESQSLRCLPLIYVPFDCGNRLHWRDRGSMFDYLYSTKANHILDFGPGDGWPSLIVAPHVDQVVGIEGSKRRCSVCRANARRMAISNVEFIHLPDNKALPFDECAFGGIMAASSVEQTPDPKNVLREFYRVLSPGGRLRIHYEAPDTFTNKPDQPAWLMPLAESKSAAFISYRKRESEEVIHYCIIFDASTDRVKSRLEIAARALTLGDFELERLKNTDDIIIGVRRNDLIQPTGPTWCRWLTEAGFTEVRPTQSGANRAGELFDSLNEYDRPRTMEEVDEFIRPEIVKAVELPVDSSQNPMITAVK